MAIIGISGYLGSGKDTIANMIQELTKVPKENYASVYRCNFSIRRFADPLKEIVAILLGCDKSDFESQEFKMKELGPEWNRTIDHAKEFLAMKFNASLIGVGGMDREEAIRWATDAGFKWTRTVREVLQEVGTDLFRNHFSPDTWVNAVMSNYNHKEHNWLMPDMRFENELLAVKNRGGLVIRINRGPKTSNHSSETSLDKFTGWDYIFDNTGSLEQLNFQVIDFLTKFKFQEL